MLSQILSTSLHKVPYFYSLTASPDSQEPATLEALNLKIRLLTWFISFVYLLHEPCAGYNAQFFIYCLIFIPTWLFYLYLLLKKDETHLTGLPAVFIFFIMTGVVLYNGGYCLRLIGSSLGILAMFAIQGFPPYLIIGMGIGYLFLQKQFFYHMAGVYDQNLDSFIVPAKSMEGTVSGWRSALILETICLVLYQVALRKLWSSYQNVKENLLETNKKLQETNDQLAKTIEELGVKNADLKKALESQDLFVACVSHELRNPLNVMLGSLDILESQAKDENQLKTLKTSKLCGNSLLSQINNLLDVAKIKADKLEISEFSTNMNTFFDKFWAFTSIGLNKKGLTGRLAIDRKLPAWLNIDALRLEQILNNLVGNAVKFTTRGSVRVTVYWKKASYKTQSEANISFEKKEQPGLMSSMSSGVLGSVNEIFEDKCEARETGFLRSIVHRNRMKDLTDFLCFKPGQSLKSSLDEALTAPRGVNYLRIDIVDTGCGITNEEQEKIFEPFVQADASITRKYGGTGLGLYIAKSLVEKMGGTIIVYGKKDVGTRFQLIIPIKSTQQQQAADLKFDLEKGLLSLNSTTSFLNRSLDQPKIQGTLTVPSVKRVMIVDDDKLNQTLLITYFKNLGFVCDYADNGLEAVNLYKTNLSKYTLITMDIQMPVMDGKTACKKIRALEKEVGSMKRTPIIMATANCSENERRECLESEEIGASYFFRKPFRLSDCEICVQKILAEPVLLPNDTL